MLIMYFCYQSENAYIFYVIVFDKQVTLSFSFVCFFRLMSDERPECIVNWLKNPSLIFYYQSAFQFKCKCARFRARSALRPAALCLFWLVSEVSYVQLGQRQFKYSCGHYLENFMSGKCGSSGREREKEKAIVLALLLRNSWGFASMSFQSTPACSASGTRSNIR